MLLLHQTENYYVFKPIGLMTYKSETVSQSCRGIWPAAIKDFKFFRACLEDEFEISIFKVLFFCSAFEDDLDSLNVVTTGRVVPFLHLLLRGTYHQPLMNKSDKAEDVPKCLCCCCCLFVVNIHASHVAIKAFSNYLKVGFKKV